MIESVVSGETRAFIWNYSMTQPMVDGGRIRDVGEIFTVNVPNARGFGRIFEQHCVACIRSLGLASFWQLETTFGNAIVLVSNTVYCLPIAVRVSLTNCYFFSTANDIGQCVAVSQQSVRSRHRCAALCDAQRNGRDLVRIDSLGSANKAVGGRH